MKYIHIFKYNANYYFMFSQLVFINIKINFFNYFNFNYKINLILIKFYFSSSGFANLNFFSLGSLLNKQSYLEGVKAKDKYFLL